MIDIKFIDDWRKLFPWTFDYQVEQDLILSVAIVMIFGDEYLAKRLVMLGGTAIYKLIYKMPTRYSEDIDFALANSVSSDEIYQIVARVRNILEPWLGKPTIKGKRRITMTFHINATYPIPVKIRLKLDFDTVENFSVMEYRETEYVIQNGFFNGNAEVRTLQLEECIAKKLRALGEPSRIKGRDLFDIWYALRYGKLNVNEMLKCFYVYMDKSGKDYSKEHFEKILVKRLQNKNFRDDPDRLVNGVADWEIDKASIEVKESIIAKLPSRHR